MSTSTHKIRPCTKHDIVSIYGLTTLEKWGIDLGYLHCMFDLNPTGWFVAESKSGEVIGVRALLFIDCNLAAGGIWVVKKEYRGKGLGRRLYNTAKAETGTRSVILETEDINHYTRKGFVYDYTIHRKRFNVGNLVDTLQPMKYKRCGISVYNDNMFPEILKYDFGVRKRKRAEFIKKFVVGGCDTIGVSIATGGSGVGHVTGYGCLRKADGFLRIAPLYADSEDIALSMMSFLLQNVDRSKTVDIIIVDGDRIMEDLTSKIDNLNLFTLCKMCKGSRVEVDLAKVVSLACECFCIV